MALHLATLHLKPAGRNEQLQMHGACREVAHLKQVKPQTLYSPTPETPSHSPSNLHRKKALRPLEARKLY